MGSWTDTQGRGELAILKEATKHLKFNPGAWVFAVMFDERF